MCEKEIKQNQNKPMETTILHLSKNTNWKKTIEENFNFIFYNISPTSVKKFKGYLKYLNIIINSFERQSGGSFFEP